MQEAEVKDAAQRRAYWVAGAALASLLSSGWLLMAPGERSPQASVEADGYSRSAVGHFGLIRLLRELGEPVVQMRIARSLGAAGLLVLAEPADVQRADELRVRALIETVPCVLVVLPKRRGDRDPVKKNWIDDADLVPPADVERVLQHVETWTEKRAASVVRVDAVRDWTMPDGWPVPDLAAPVQLLAPSSLIEPLIEAPDGVLLGRIGDMHVLADPDVLNNHGLVRGDNAALAVTMLRELRGDGAIVIDETLHGHHLEPSVWHLAGSFPFVLVTVQLLLLAALTVWTAAGRFGPVLPAAAAIGAGKEFLIDNVAALLRCCGQHGPSLRRYGRQRVRLVAAALHAPPGLDDDRCRAFLLARIADGPRRERLDGLLRATGSDMPPGRAVETARQLRELTEEMLHAGR